ncbi:MAG TPA: hypothetical protein VNM37_22600, partial [Candidatus Dormibacteraeota bacterium]|nr:hypothetical protein [Candidatus Dormibacteraeota bacterium]
MNDRFMALGNNGLVLQSDVSISNAYNSWTKPTSGNWEEPFWSLGELPSSSQAGILFTNEGFKALAIGAGTAANFPNSLQIRNLTVDAPMNSSNLLLLNFAGTATPLQISEDFVIGPQGALLNYASAVNASRLLLNNRATFAEGASASFNIAMVGSNSLGSITLSNANIGFGNLELGGGSSGLGVFYQYGGSNQVGTMVLWGRGYYNMSGGTVTVANDATVGLSSGGSDFAAVGGLIQVAGVLRLGAPTGGGSGRVLLTGASLVSDRIDVANGSYQQFAGLTSVGQMRIPSAPSALADATLSGGMLRSGQVDVGLDLSGSFYQDGGTHINTNGIFIWGRTHGGANT